MRHATFAKGSTSETSTSKVCFNGRPTRMFKLYASVNLIYYTVLTSNYDFLPKSTFTEHAIDYCVLIWL